MWGQKSKDSESASKEGEEKFRTEEAMVHIPSVHSPLFDPASSTDLSDLTQTFPDFFIHYYIYFKYFETYLTF
jgi:hypothetical protein